MAKLWCWLFGHNWEQYSEYVLRSYEIGWMMFCKRCGKTATKLIKPLL